MSTNQRSNLLNFFIYNTEYGNREGSEEEKVMLYIPQEENLDVKIKTVGLCQALAQFAKTFDTGQPCECFVTQKNKQYFLNVEGDFWMVITLTIPYVEKGSKDKMTVEYFPEDVQDAVGNAALRQAYDMFVLFNGTIHVILEKHGLAALKERFEFFYTRYLQTLNVGQLDLLDVYQGLVYLPLDKSDFLKVHCFSNMIETAFRNVQHVCILHNDQLLWTTLNPKNLKILFKYLTTSLLPTTSDTTLTDNQNSPNGSLHGSPVSLQRDSQGKFLTAPVEMCGKNTTTPKRAPRVFVDVDGESCALQLLLYKAGNLTACLMVDLQTLTKEFCAKVHSVVGPQLTNLSSAIAEQTNKRAAASTSDQQYRFLYFNSMNLAIKSSIHSRKVGSVLTSVAPDIMKLLIDLHHDFETLQTQGEIITKNTADCWIVGKRSGFREFFVVFNQKSASLVEINEEVRQLINTSFSNIFLVE